MYLRRSLAEGCSKPERQDTASLAGDILTTRTYEVADALFSGLLASDRKPTDPIGEPNKLKQLTKMSAESRDEETVGAGQNRTTHPAAATAIATAKAPINERKAPFQATRPLHKSGNYPNRWRQ